MFDETNSHEALEAEKGEYNNAKDRQSTNTVVSTVNNSTKLVAKKLNFLSLRRVKRKFKTTQKEKLLDDLATQLLQVRVFYIIY